MIDIDDVVAVESSPTSSKNSTTRAKRSINGITLPISSKMENSSSAKTAITRDELLSLYILKLDEEANYFKVSPTSPEEELCDCSKCQVCLVFDIFQYLNTLNRDIPNRDSTKNMNKYNVMFIRCSITVKATIYVL